MPKKSHTLGAHRSLYLVYRWLGDGFKLVRVVLFRVQKKRREALPCRRQGESPDSPPLENPTRTMQDGGAVEVIEPYQPVSSKARRRMWGPLGLSDIGKRSNHSMDRHAGLMRTKPRYAVRRSGFDGSSRV